MVLSEISKLTTKQTTKQTLSGFIQQKPPIPLFTFSFPLRPASRFYLLCPACLHFVPLPAFIALSRLFTPRPTSRYYLLCPACLHFAPLPAFICSVPLFYTSSRFLPLPCIKGRRSPSFRLRCTSPRYTIETGMLTLLTLFMVQG